jgi:hypothetical protein
MGFKYVTLFQRRRRRSCRYRSSTKSFLQRILHRKEAIKSLYSELSAIPRKEVKDRGKRWQNPNGRQYHLSPWRVYLEDDDNADYIRLLQDPTSTPARTFRRRFRVPWPFYKDELLPWTLERFPCRPDCTGRTRIPVEYKLLAVLRALGRSSHFDDLAEDCCSGDGGNALRLFFHEWCHQFALWGMEKHVKPPSTYEEIRESMRLYSEAGLDGCFCSLDGVHFRWDRTTYSLKNTHIGKEGYPTRGYQIAVTHNRCIISVSAGFDGP